MAVRIFESIGKNTMNYQYNYEDDNWFLPDINGQYSFPDVDDDDVGSGAPNVIYPNADTSAVQVN